MNTASTDRPAFDPPRTFDATSSVPLPEAASRSKINLGGQRVEPLPVLLDKTRAYVASVDMLEIVDVASGAVTATVRPTHEPALSPQGQNPFVGNNPAQPPVLVELAGRRRVVTAFAATAPGQGTTPPRPVVEVVTIDADTGDSAQRFELDPGTINQNSVRPHPVVLGAHGPVVVVQVGTDALAVDLNNQRELWRRKEFTAGAVAEDVVVGTDTRTPVARALAVDGGTERWHGDAARTITIKPGGPTVVTATGTTAAGKQFFRLLDATSGRVLDESLSSGSIGYAIDCIHDGADVTVCRDAGAGKDWAGAFDRSGKWLWQLPDEKANRVAPTVTAAWHGAVYGRTANGPVVLDAHTGADRETAPGVAPWLVNQYVAVASPPDATGGVRLYRAKS